MKNELGSATMTVIGVPFLGCLFVYALILITSFGGRI